MGYELVKLFVPEDAALGEKLLRENARHISMIKCCQIKLENDKMDFCYLFLLWLILFNSSFEQ